MRRYNIFDSSCGKADEINCTGIKDILYRKRIFFYFISVFFFRREICVPVWFEKCLEQFNFSFYTSERAEEEGHNRYCVNDIEIVFGFGILF